MADEATPKQRHGEPPLVDYVPRDRPLNDSEMAQARMGYAVWKRSTDNNVSYGFMVDDNPPEFPDVELNLNDATITYRGEKWAGVPRTSADMLLYIIAKMPQAAGLQPAFGDHPERALKKLPKPIYERLKMISGKGYIFQP